MRIWKNEIISAYPTARFFVPGGVPPILIDSGPTLAAPDALHQQHLAYTAKDFPKVIGASKFPVVQFLNLVDNANITDYISATVNLGAPAYVDSIFFDTNEPSHMAALNSISVIVKHYDQGGRYTESDFVLD